jgi:hypothetical protein
MKKALIYLFLSVSLNLHSQTYMPLLDTTTIWTVEYNDYVSLPPESWQVQYNFEKDTLIDLINYKYFGNNAILREDTINRKVYLRENSLNHECLLYDFNAKKGDTIEVCNFQILIDSVSTVKICNGHERKIFYYQGKYYIEGIGSNLGFLETIELIGPPITSLNCVKKGDIVLYGCNEVSYRINLQNYIQINIFPNPTNSILKFDSDLVIKSFRIIDITGNCVLQDIIQESKIDLGNFKSGFYIIEFYDDKNKFVGKNEFIFY